FDSVALWMMPTTPSSFCILKTIDYIPVRKIDHCFVKHDCPFTVETIWPRDVRFALESGHRVWWRDVR
ncbi:MAG: hypothetical protein WAN68_14430, partial [Pseudolabrys sp.]